MAKTHSAVHDPKAFVKGIANFAKKCGIEADKVVKKITLHVHKEIMLRTPVDTGYARCNWQIGIESRPDGTIDARVKSGQPAIEGALAQAVNIKAGGVNYIANNLPYIAALEFGHSKQSPSGMVRVTVSRWQAIVNEAARSA
jgi:hypothetical protein